jgi:hypothetical protein
LSKPLLDHKYALFPTVEKYKLPSAILIPPVSTFSPDTAGCFVHFSPAPICKYPPFAEIFIVLPVIAEPCKVPPVILEPVIVDPVLISPVKSPLLACRVPLLSI